MLMCPDHLTTKMQLGMWGEGAIAGILRRAGYDVRKQKRADGGDLFTCGLKIEVKTAYRNNKGMWNYCLKKADKYGHTDHERADLVILLAVAPSGLVTTFVIPCDALSDKCALTIPRLRGYKGKYAEYRKPVVDGLRRFMQ